MKNGMFARIENAIHEIEGNWVIQKQTRTKMVLCRDDTCCLRWSDGETGCEGQMVRYMSNLDFNAQLHSASLRASALWQHDAAWTEVQSEQ